MLRYDGHDAHGHCVGFRQISRHELNSGVAQSHEKSRVSRQAVELGNDQSGARHPAPLQRGHQLWPVIAFASFDLHELRRDNPPAPATDKLSDGLALRL